MTVTSDYGHTALLERPDEEQKAADHLWFHGWDMDWEELTEREGLKVFARAKDSTLYDVRGREYLDGLSGLLVVNVGHGRREIGEAMAEQAGEIAYAASSNYTTIPTVQLAETLAESRPATSAASSSAPVARRRSRPRSRSPSRSRRCAGFPSATRSSPAAAPTTG